jgi:hypothetical protein
MAKIATASDALQRSFLLSQAPIHRHLMHQHANLQWVIIKKHYGLQTKPM